MNTFIARSFIVLSSLIASTAAHAQSVPVASLRVGEWIAAQGNAALQEVVDDLRHQLNETLEPIRPERSPAPSAIPTAGSATAPAQGKPQAGG